ncbi:MAG: hypothetical protein HY774_25460 [Acidobacteria bacterium]|nr:hypothetical protein [Acidobacteriota bacterium]
MPTFQVRSESLPKRCEVCHQSDVFHPRINFCARCSPKTLKKKKPLIVSPGPSANYRFRRRAFPLLILNLLILGLIGIGLSWGYLTYLKHANTRNAVFVLDKQYWFQKFYFEELKCGQYTDRPAYVFPHNAQLSLLENFLDLATHRLRCRVFDSAGQRKEHEQGRYSGYQMKFFLTNTDGKSHFCTIMFPIQRDGIFQTGTDCFYIDDTGVLRHSGNPKVLAHAASPEYPAD